MLMRVRGVNRVRAKGRTYYYHRATGKRLTAEPGTAAFLREIEAAEKAAAPKPTARAGTLGALIGAYRASPEFAGLAPETRRGYERVFNWLQTYEAATIVTISQANVVALRDKAYAAHKRHFANYVVTVLRLLFAWAKPRDWLGPKQGNPAEDVPRIKRPKLLAKQNRAWTDGEREAVLAAASGGLLRVIALGMFAAQSEGDAVRFPWAGYRDGAIAFTRKKTGVDVWMPAHRRLRAVLDSTPREFKLGRRQKGAVVTSTIVAIGAKRGRPQPFTESGFRASFFKLIRKLEADGKVGPGLTFHGLRHTVGKLLDEAGCDPKTISTILGHSTTKQSEHYAAEGDRKRRAKLALVAWEKNE